MVNREHWSWNKTRAPDAASAARVTQPVKCSDGYCTNRKWSGGLAEESWAASWGFQTYLYALKLYTWHPWFPHFICLSKGFG
jgi:hypothetical protein